MPRRVFSRALKLDLVRCVVAGACRPAQVCRAYGISPSTLSQWRTEYTVRGDAAFTPRTPAHAEALERRLAELERRCQHLTLENTLLKTCTVRKFAYRAKKPSEVVERYAARR